MIQWLGQFSSQIKSFTRVEILSYSLELSSQKCIILSGKARIGYPYHFLEINGNSPKSVTLKQYFIFSVCTDTRITGQN